LLVFVSSQTVAVHICKLAAADYVEIKNHCHTDSGSIPGKTKTLHTRFFHIISCISFHHAYIYTPKLKHTDPEGI